VQIPHVSAIHTSDTFDLSTDHPDSELITSTAVTPPGNAGDVERIADLIAELTNPTDEPTARRGFADQFAGPVLRGPSNTWTCRFGVADPARPVELDPGWFGASCASTG
jgi:hypothetical protein